MRDPLRLLRSMEAEDRVMGAIERGTQLGRAGPRRRAERSRVDPEILRPRARVVESAHVREDRGVAPPADIGDDPLRRPDDRRVEDRGGTAPRDVAAEAREIADARVHRAAHASSRDASAAMRSRSRA